MICKNPDCKHEIPDEALFCPDCGWEQNVPVDSESPKDEDIKESDGYFENGVAAHNEEPSFYKDDTEFIRNGIQYFRIQTYNKRWIHSEPCKGDLYLGEDAICICRKCKAEAPITYWKTREEPYGDSIAAEINDEPNDAVTEMLQWTGEPTSIAGLKWLNNFTHNLIIQINKNK